jgi:hypothetical protein
MERSGRLELEAAYFDHVEGAGCDVCTCADKADHRDCRRRCVESASFSMRAVSVVVVDFLSCP